MSMVRIALGRMKRGSRRGEWTYLLLIAGLLVLVFVAMLVVTLV